MKPSVIVDKKAVENAMIVAMMIMVV